MYSIDPVLGTSVCGSFALLFAVAGLLAVYAAAMALNLSRGHRYLECGCLGPRGGGMISRTLVWRTSLMAVALATTGVVRWSDRPLGWLYVGTVLGAVCALALLHVAATGLLGLGTRRQLERWPAA